MILSFLLVSTLCSFHCSLFLSSAYPFYSVVCSCPLHPCSLDSSVESRPSLISSPEHRMRVIGWQQQEHPIRSWPEPWQTLCVAAAVTAALKAHCLLPLMLLVSAAQGGHHGLTTLWHTSSESGSLVELKILKCHLLIVFSKLWLGWLGAWFKASSARQWFKVYIHSIYVYIIPHKYDAYKTGAN